MSVKVEVKGIERASRFLSKKNKQTDSLVSEGIGKATLFLQGEVKASIAGRRNEPTSVDTGRFLNSVDIQTMKDNGVVFSKTPYAKFLEFGTSSRKARKHFNNSKDRNKQKIGEIVQDQVNKI